MSTSWQVNYEEPSMILRALLGASLGPPPRDGWREALRCIEELVRRRTRALAGTSQLMW